MTAWDPLDSGLHGNQVASAVTLPQIPFALNAVFIP